MAVYCPECWAKARCLDSRCDPLTNTVRRRHECIEASCKHRFTSVEIIVGAVDLRAGYKSSLIEIAWQIFDSLGGDKSEEMFIEQWQGMADARKNRKKSKADKDAVASARPYHKPSALHPWRRIRSIPKL